MYNLSKSLLGAIAAVGVIAAVPAYAGMPSAVLAPGIEKAEPNAGFHKKKHRKRHYARDQRVHDNTRIWRGDDGRYRCRRDDGTTGLLIGAAVGGLAGNEIAGRGDKLLGTVIGAGAGALLGREIDRSNARCR